MASGLTELGEYFGNFLFHAAVMSVSFTGGVDQDEEEEEEESLRGRKWGLSSSFISSLIGDCSMLSLSLLITAN